MPLTIGTKEVNNLSGPVSMYILEPTDEYLERFPYAPILILLGDAHYSDKNFCKEIDERHHAIYDVEFLKLLSDEVGDGNVVDFYVEGGDFHNVPPTDHESKEPMKLIWDLFTTCCTSGIERRLDDKQREKCLLIKNIKWQSADIRFYGHFAERYSIFKFLEFFPNVVQTIKEKGFDTFRETIISRIRSECKNDFANKLSDLQSCMVTVEHFHNDILEDYFKDKNSLITAQLNKIGIKYRNNITLLLCNYVMKITNKQVINMKNFQSINQDFIHLFEEDDLYSDNSLKLFKNLWEHFNNGKLREFYNFVSDTENLLLDVYALARIYKRMIKPMSKKQDKQDRPLITICYFGESHVNNMYNFLIEKKDKTNDYKSVLVAPKEIRLGNNPDESNRCIEINSVYNLGETIKQLIIKRKAYEKSI